MARYDHIDAQSLTLIKENMRVNDPYIKRITGSGNNEIIDLQPFGVVPRVRPTLGADEKYAGTITVYIDRVEYDVIALTDPEIAAVLAAEKDQLKEQLENSAQEATERHSPSRLHVLQYEATLLRRAEVWTAQGYPTPSPKIIKEWDETKTTKPGYIISAETIIANSEALEVIQANIGRIRRRRRNAIDSAASLAAAQVEADGGKVELTAI